MQGTAHISVEAGELTCSPNGLRIPTGFRACRRAYKTARSCWAEREGPLPDDQPQLRRGSAGCARLPHDFPCRRSLQNVSGHCVRHALL